jgi:hypothetical protein
MRQLTAWGPLRLTCALDLWHPCMQFLCILPLLPTALLPYTPTTLNILTSTPASYTPSPRITNHTTLTSRTRITRITHKVTSWTAPRRPSATRKLLPFTPCSLITQCMLRTQLSQLHSICRPLQLALHLQQSWLSTNRHTHPLRQPPCLSKGLNCLLSMARLV